MYSNIPAESPIVSSQYVQLLVSVHQKLQQLVTKQRRADPYSQKLIRNLVTYLALYTNPESHNAQRHR